MATRYPGLDKLYFHPRQPGGPLEQRAIAYAKDVIDFFATLRQWLESVPAKGFKVSEEPSQFLYWDAHYDAPLLSVELGERKLKAIPTGINMPGMGLVEFLMDLEHRDSDTHRLAVAQQKEEPGAWSEIQKDPPRPPKFVPFTQQRFTEFINEVFEP